MFVGVAELCDLLELPSSPQSLRSMNGLLRSARSCGQASWEVSLTEERKLGQEEGDMMKEVAFYHLPQKCILSN